MAVLVVYKISEKLVLNGSFGFISALKEMLLKNKEWEECGIS